MKNYLLVKFGYRLSLIVKEVQIGRLISGGELGCENMDRIGQIVPISDVSLGFDFRRNEAD